MIFDLNSSMLSGTTTIQRQLWLTEAQTAYATLMIGGKPVSVSYEGKSVTYSASDAPRLQSWIDLLLLSLGKSRPRRAMRPYFR